MLLTSRILLILSESCFRCVLVSASKKPPQVLNSKCKNSVKNCNCRQKRKTLFTLKNCKNLTHTFWLALRTASNIIYPQRHNSTVAPNCMHCACMKNFYFSSSFRLVLHSYQSHRKKWKREREKKRANESWVVVNTKHLTGWVAHIFHQIHRLCMKSDAKKTKLNYLCRSVVHAFSFTLSKKNFFVFVYLVSIFANFIFCFKKQSQKMLLSAVDSYDIEMGVKGCLTRSERVID